MGLSVLVILMGCGILSQRGENARPMQVLAQYPADTEEALPAYLFGSQVTGTAGPQSDYDIALLIRNPSLDLQTRLAHEIGAISGADQVNVVFLNRVPVELAYAVIA